MTQSCVSSFIFTENNEYGSKSHGIEHIVAMNTDLIQLEDVLDIWLIYWQ
ncbi:hypothetical protein GCM10009193_04780 [Shewanella aestuarii]|nr:hypothetical protein GCM10009193_04780 [Shewanella aestuarii]